MQIKSKEINSYKSKLKKYRVAKGFTQKDLAALSGVNTKSIALYEQNPIMINRASCISVKSLADCLECTMEELVE